MVLWSKLVKVAIIQDIYSYLNVDKKEKILMNVNSLVLTQNIQLSFNKKEWSVWIEKGLKKELAKVIRGYLGTDIIIT